MVGTSHAPARSPSVAGLTDRVALLKAMADPTRLQVLEMLADCDERCHCELEEALEIPANRLSFHLKVLRDAGLVGTRRRGRRVFYHVHPATLEVVRAVLPAPGTGAGDTAAACCAGAR